MSIRKIMGVVIDADTLDGHDYEAPYLFASEADDLADVIETSTPQADLAAETYATHLNIASGGCRFLGGLVAFSNATQIEMKVTVDGGAEQTLAPSTIAPAGWRYIVALPPIKADTSLLIRAYNKDAATAYWWGAVSWYRAL